MNVWQKRSSDKFSIAKSESKLTFPYHDFSKYGG
jgi:hypothetical protein